MKGCTERDFASLPEVTTPGFPRLRRCMTEMRELLRLGVPVKQNQTARSRRLSGRIKCWAKGEQQERDRVAVWPVEAEHSAGSTRAKQGERVSEPNPVQAA